MNNPLLALDAEIPFDQIRPEHVEPAIDALLTRAQAGIDAIASAPEPRTYAATLAALEAATEPLEIAMGIVEHLENVATSPALREAHNAVVPKVSAFWSSIPLHEGLWRALSGFSQSEEARSLDVTRRRLLEKTLDEFKRHGAMLPAADKARLSALDQELSQLTTKFSQNVLDATNAFELVITDEARLAGLPESAREAARESAQVKGLSGYRFSLQAPSLTAVLTYADDATLRRELWAAYNRRATDGAVDNRALLGRILELRRQKANLLGFGHFADLVCEDRMAKTGEAARRFIDELTERTRPAFERENAELVAFRRELEGPTAPELAPWDVAYYAEKMRRARFDFDEEELRAYFPAERVLQGAFETAERLYGVRIQPAQGLPVWDPAVRAYRLLDGEAELGLFYVDLYPRENKGGGAWMHGIVAAVPPAPHLAVMVANANPPVGDKPSLLTHRDVETLFHEFGHLLHHLLSRVAVRSLACTRVAQDFVELPSQIMENWCVEREALNLFAAHYRTGEPVPEALFDRLRRVRTFRAGNMQMRQLGFATVDLALHVNYDPQCDGDVLAYARQILAGFSPTPLPEDYGMIASFSHLFAHPVGYAAGYYSYKWAEVLDADAFSRFKSEGIFSASVGADFREKLLARGDARDPMELFVDFMGREPELEPLLIREGLLTPPGDSSSSPG